MLNSTLPWIGQVLLPGLCAAKTHPYPPACRRRAQEIEPGYCEPTYWIGMTTFNMGDPLTGLSTMKASLSCKYTASEALQALNKVYLMMMEAGKNADVGPMLVRGGGRMWLCCVMVMEKPLAKTWHIRICAGMEGVQDCANLALTCMCMPIGPESSALSGVHAYRQQPADAAVKLHMAVNTDPQLWEPVLMLSLSLCCAGVGGCAGLPACVASG